MTQNPGGPSPPVVLVTGASGFVGRHCCHLFAARGYQVRSLVRNMAVAPREAGTAYRCDLLGAIDMAAFRGAAVLVHCAWDTRSPDRGRAACANVEGARRLLALCREQGVGQVVFLSSLSATAPSAYGWSKLKVEGLLDPERDLALRAGLVIGEGGLFARMRAWVRRPLVPLIDGGHQPLQTIWVDDLCMAIESAVRKRLTGRCGLAEPEGVTLAALLRDLAAALGCRPLFVPVPGAPALAAARGLERLGLRTPVTSDNLLGLRALRHFDVRRDLARLGVSPRAWRESLALMVHFERGGR